MAGKREQWVVHPNRSEIGPDEPGRNGHFRSISRPRRPTAAALAKKCFARVMLPPELSHHADADGSVTFSAYDWRFVVGAARTFARLHTEVQVPPPFGFKDRGKWWWWDGTTSDESILEGPDAIGYVQEFFTLLFPGMAITVTDQREQ
ncbi:MAG: hypothetical protein K0U76_17220 [Actinomycetia bacterium]|nr:hypothetical protein [Actinomycetes bacterium]MCH9703090.1 hypothetical protein [Actinomycetes bacterium]MCH9734962.1 hypothetical protein [Actinomycetes bacterium]